MMKNVMKIALATAVITQAFIIGGASAASSTTPSAATKATAPVMLDNLEKYGLKKDVELPVTVTAGGFSYTLEKIMIYETQSATAQALIKKYGFTGTEGQKYFIWTKMTIKNDSKATVQFNIKDRSYKWRFNFGEESMVSMPEKFAEKVNNAEALWTWELAPGKSLTSYQAYKYNGKFNWFYVSLKIKNVKSYLEVVKQ